MRTRMLVEAFWKIVQVSRRVRNEAFFVALDACARAGDHRWFIARLLRETVGVASITYYYNSLIAV